MKMENEVMAMSKQAHAREAMWKERGKKQEVEYYQVLKQVQEICAMTHQDGESMKVALRGQIAILNGENGELREEVNRLAEQVLLLDHQRKDMEATRQSEIVVSHSLCSSVETPSLCTCLTCTCYSGREPQHGQPVDGPGEVQESR